MIKWQKGANRDQQRSPDSLCYFIIQIIFKVPRLQFTSANVSFASLLALMPFSILQKNVCAKVMGWWNLLDNKIISKCMFIISVHEKCIFEYSRRRRFMRFERKTTCRQLFRSAIFLSVLALFCLILSKINKIVMMAKRDGSRASGMLMSPHPGGFRSARRTPWHQSLTKPSAWNK